MRARLIAAFIVVALLAALASAWVANLILPFYPSLGNLIRAAWISHLLGSHVPGAGRLPPGPGVPARATALAFVLAASGLLLATITGLAFAASAGCWGRCGGWPKRRGRCRAVTCRSGSSRTAGTSWPSWSRRSTPWPLPCRARSASWNRWRPGPACSPVTSHMSCGHR